MKQLIWFLLLLVIYFCSIEAKEYTVGDATGWQVVNLTFYQQWASGKTFTTADILVFNFSTGAHNVVPVSKAAFDDCDTKVTSNLISTGPAKVPLETNGTHYYICTVGPHCTLGQKLTINVSMSTMTTASPPPPAAASTTGSPPSAASTVAVASSVMFLGIVINLLF